VRTIPVAISRRRRRDRATTGDGAVHATTTCRAPSTSLHLDQLGDVRPCCQSTYVLGNVEHDSLDEIWHGPRAEALREAVGQGDLSLGCGYCEWAVRSGHDDAAYARRFDEDEIPEPGAGPTRIEIAPSNTCNLQCTMCNGEWSSSIRSQREGLPPLPKRYGDPFFAQLEHWLPGLHQVDVFGGEPFLARESLRLLELLAERAPHVTGLVTTNGTIWNERVERVLNDLRISITVSVDGATEQTYEAIRVGATWEVLQQNLDRFQRACERSGTSFSLTHCLVVENWWELPEMVRWAARLGVPLYINTVTSPPASSLHHLTIPELAHVVTILERDDKAITRLGEPWASVWRVELDRLRDSLEDQRHGRVHAHVGVVTAEAAATERGSVEAWADARRLRFSLDERLVVTSMVTEHERRDLPTVDVGGTVGRSMLAAHQRVELGRSRQWSEDGVSITEAVHLLDGVPVVERRSVEGAPPVTRVDVAQLPLPDEPALRARAQASSAVAEPVVELEIDGDGVLLGALPSVADAERWGFRPVLGATIGSAADLLPSGLTTPQPAVQTATIDPITTVTRLAWPDGQVVHATARERYDGRRQVGAKVFLAVTAVASGGAQAQEGDL
jgi:MoaA/NifB/PqqE/SkfB family radical SAM enzyme